MMKTFTQFLADLNGGSVTTDLDRELEKLQKAVFDTGRKGKLTLTVELEPGGVDGDTGEVDRVKVNAKVKPDLPRRGHGTDQFWIDRKYGLSREHPKQRALNLVPDADESDDQSQQANDG